MNAQAATKTHAKFQNRIYPEPIEVKKAICRIIWKEAGEKVNSHIKSNYSILFKKIVEETGFTGSRASIRNYVIDLVKGQKLDAKFGDKSGNGSIFTTTMLTYSFGFGEVGSSETPTESKAIEEGPIEESENVLEIILDDIPEYIPVPQEILPKHIPSTPSMDMNSFANNILEMASSALSADQAKRDAEESRKYSEVLIEQLIELETQLNESKKKNREIESFSGDLIQDLKDQLQVANSQINTLTQNLETLSNTSKYSENENENEKTFEKRLAYIKKVCNEDSMLMVEDILHVLQNLTKPGSSQEALALLALQNIGLKIDDVPFHKLWNTVHLTRLAVGE